MKTLIQHEKMYIFLKKNNFVYNIIYHFLTKKEYILRTNK